MKGWLHTIRWKNILIIWLSIGAVVFPYYNVNSNELFIEFFLWGVVCSFIAMIGNITNDMLDVEADKLNNKPNIFSNPKNKRTAFGFMFFLLICAVISILLSVHQVEFARIAGSSLVLLLGYNIWSKKWPLIGNLVISVLTCLVFLGIDMIVMSRISYLELGFSNMQIEMLACFAFSMTLIREMMKDAEDRKGDSAIGARTLAHYVSDKVMAVIIILLALILPVVIFMVMRWRHEIFFLSYYSYTGWFMTMSLVGAFFMMTKGEKKYILASRLIKWGMVGCLCIYLFISFR